MIQRIERAARVPCEPGFRRISISVPAELVVRIDLLVTRSDHPHRSVFIADAMKLYLKQEAVTRPPRALTRRSPGR
jgi:metal-responsive CopG/Arc/MetJ family transcriptional regulator